MESDSAYLRQAAEEHLHFQGNLESKTIAELASDKKLPLNVLAVALLSSKAGSPRGDLLRKLVDPSNFKQLRNSDKFFRFFVKSMITKDTKCDFVMPFLNQYLASLPTGGASDMREFSFVVNVASKLVSWECDGAEQVCAALVKLFEEACQRLLTAKNKAKVVKSRELMRVVLPTLRVVASSSPALSSALGEVGSKLYRCLQNSDRVIAAHAIAVCEALCRSPDKQDFGHLQTAIQQGSAKSQNEAGEACATDLCRLAGHCIQVNYDSGDGGGEEEASRVEACRKLLVSSASGEDVQVFVEATKQLSSDICTCDLKRDLSQDEASAIQDACKRSWGFLSSSDQGEAIHKIVCRLSSLLSSADRDLQRATFCCTALSLLKCAALGSDGTAGTAGSSLTLTLIHTLRDELDRSESMSLYFLFCKCMLWGTGLTAEVGLKAEDIGLRLGVIGERVSDMQLLDLMSEVLLFFSWAKEDHAEELLLLMSTLAQHSGPKAMEHLEAAWKKCMQGTELMKASAIANALHVLSTGTPHPTTCSASRMDQAQLMKWKSVDFVAENMNFAFSDYQWEGRPKEELARAKTFSRSLGECGAAVPLMSHALRVLEEALLSSGSAMKKKLVQALLTLAVRSNQPFQNQSCAILRSASCTSTGATQQLMAWSMEIMDEFHRVQGLFDAKVEELGADPKEWPEEEIRESEAKHLAMLDKLCSICFIPRHLYLPLGLKSKGFLEFFHAPSGVQQQDMAS
ncbi:hypothetical protein HOP50_01g04930 [Chloropicon primus]|uniref:Uncharacterized protein n=1 Tax=Chloropicon primus TaxID=1764295 RepID=A0A5B8MC27_9CHLO|nr:hypothetical protein A3770_01p05050 [Chloropicon primus]UPQ97202.1 hypothetical protein HOP50_01g04930 [Chloropicon primus]|eukprot:QDZ17987.1 hypothetical protein A3770_01p05050 [Chloropicon primus]